MNYRRWDIPLTDDGFDENGKPLNPRRRQPYIRGSEAACGSFKPVEFGQAIRGFFDKRVAAIEIGGSAESPIEQDLGAAIVIFFRGAGKPIKLCLMYGGDKPADELLLVPQFKWSFYRSDWAIVGPNGVLLIECDGRDFHSSSAQLLHDKKKDAAALERGYLTLRFTGKQIHKNPDRCAQKIWDAVYGGGQ